VRQQVPSQFIGNLLDLWKLKIITQELLPKDFQTFETSQILADQLMPGDKNFNKSLLACQSMSKRVVQWQLSFSFWYVPPTPSKNKSLIIFFNRMGKMFNKLFDHFYWGCHVVEEATRQMMVELNRIGVNYDKQMVRKKRRIDKALGRFELFYYLKVTEKEVDCK